jgi:tripartite-type tricarboxylate transporter receptor subunit TctC
MFAAAALVALTVAASAQDFPTKPIRYVLNASPGGATDVMARKLQPALEKAFGQSVVIENRAGGRGAAQMVELTTAKPDGYTIGSVTNSHIGAFNQTLKQFNIDSVDWVARLVSESYLLAVPTESGINSLADLLKKIKEKPGMAIAGFGRGSGGHVMWEMFAQAAKLAPTDSRWVPYDGVGDAVTAALGGHVGGVVAYVDLVRPHVEAGKLKVIAILAKERVTALPEAPTFAEQGFALDAGWEQFRGIIAPKGMPADIQQKLAAAFQKALGSEEMVRYIKESALQNSYAPPAEFAPYVRQQDQLTKDWLQKLGMTN